MGKKLKKTIAYLLTLISVLSCILVYTPSASAANYNKHNVFFFLKNSMGMSTASACGVMANIEKESSFNPNATGDSGTSYGICQWHNSRWEALKKFCNSNGYDWKTLTGQLYYLKHEFENSYPNTLKIIKGVENTSDGAYIAADAFCRYYEIPANLEATAAQRGNLAKNTYWKNYGFSENYAAPFLKLNSDFTSVSSRNSFKLSWSKAKGDFDRYKIVIVKCIDGTAEYDWGSSVQYTVSSSKTSYIIPEAELSMGNYMAYIYAYEKETGNRSDYSNLLYFSVYDELIYECSEPSDGKVYDALTDSQVLIEGWAVNTGKKQVDFLVQLDEGEIKELTPVSMEDIYQQYSKFCVNDKVGYSHRILTKDLSNGKHTISVYVKSETISGLLSQVSFTVKNSHEHEFINYIDDNNATYSADGTKTAKCEHCNTTHSVTLSGTKRILGRTSGLTANGEDTSVSLSWKKVSGATGYRIYRYDGGWKAIKTTTATSCTVNGVSPGTEHIFAVKAYVKENGNTVWAPTYRKVSVTTRPVAPTKVSFASTTSSVTLSWSKCTGATGYRIYRYTSSGWKTVKTITALSYKITGLNDGTKYIFAVKPYKKTDSGYLWASSYTKITTATKTETPAIRLASTAKGRATIAWNNVTGENGYQVWYSTSKNGSYKKLSNYKANTVKAYKTGFTSGKTYYFKVRAYKTAGDKYVYSSFSSVKSLKIK